MKQIRYGLIGCGQISANHLRAATEIGMDIIALCDINMNAAKERADQFSLPSVPLYADHEEMLRKEAPDLVAIAAASGARTKIALDCIKSKVNIIIEKPIALSIADADSIIEESKNNNTMVCVCHQNRFNPSIQKTRFAIENGQLGKLLHAAANIRWNRNEEYYRQAAWRGTWAHDGGALMNQCIHSIDLIRWLMGGYITEVFAYTDRLAHPHIETEDFGVALIKFSNGSYGIIEGTTNVYPSNYEETLCVFGTEGTVKISGKSVNTIETWVLKGSEENPKSIAEELAESSDRATGHTALYKDAADAIREERAPYIDAEEGKKAIELVLAIHLSAASGQPVKLPLEEGAATDYIGRFC